MSYCQVGEIATVDYTFGDGSKGRFISEDSPIIVETSSSESSNTYNYYDPNLPGNRTVKGTSYTTEFRSECQQGQTAIKIYNNGELITLSCFLAGSLTTQLGEIQGCSLKVNTVSGVNLFTVNGKCPVNFTVGCGDNCPEGSHKCTHNKYPGYCCVPCKEVGDRLKNMANKVGR
ncbi:MAG TPA: hypothetical protein VE944_31255 [Nostoc sp.]|uniref:hypothetical protein n=1 Tax=Nostoc sp. TaxID=1180 RepID=UPI002D5B27A9|nr:hypothetical protein [Nostoc sp.]HYX18769.1 hypothetical protein [Nostoc sp.]